MTRSARNRARGAGEAHAVVDAVCARVRERVNRLGDALVQVELSSDSSGGARATKMNPETSRARAVRG